MRLVTVVCYARGTDLAFPPEKLMTELFNSCRSADLNPQGSSDRFEARTPNGHLLVFEVKEASLH